jgi:hypothetical protein
MPSSTLLSTIDGHTNQHRAAPIADYDAGHLSRKLKANSRRHSLPYLESPLGGRQ